MSSPNTFSILADLTSYERKIAICKAEDLIKIEEAQGDQPARFEIKPEAATHEITIRALTDEERASLDLIVDKITPPPMYREDFADNGTTLKSRVPIGHDEEDTNYLLQRKAARAKQFAMVAITGCPSLRQSTEGESIEEKAELLRKKIDKQLIGFIAGNILNLGYTAGDSTSFFSKAASGSTPS